MLSINGQRRARTMPIRKLRPAAVLLRRLERLLAILRRGRTRRRGRRSAPAISTSKAGTRTSAAPIPRSTPRSSRSTRTTSTSSRSRGRIRPAENYSFNPIVVGNTMYVLAKGRSIVALDAATGRELWAHANDGAVGTRGMNYWQSADGSDERLLFLNDGSSPRSTRRPARRSELRHRRPRRAARRPRRRHPTIRPLKTNNPGRIFEDLSSSRCRPAAPTTPRHRPTSTPTTCAPAR